MSFAAKKASLPPRFATKAIHIGSLGLGGDNPIVIQSMTTTDTMDVEKTVQQVRDLVDAGCQMVRITAPTVQDAEALRSIREKLVADKINVPLVADIHFLPAAAMVAAEYVDKVRINPGNYADRKMFKVREYTDKEYKEELERIHEKFSPLVLKLRSLDRALRIGTNHGSLSDRILNRYGDTPEGMVASAFEFAEICRHHDFHNFCFSMKASNVAVMVKAYRLLVERQIERGWAYPIHLGVTEAGDGEDGRMKSAIGIGTLLNEGIGDTIRVSLTEAAVKEIPVARAIAARFPRDHEPVAPSYSLSSLPEKSELPLVWMEVDSVENLKDRLSTTSLRPDVVLFKNAADLSMEAHLLKLQLKNIFGQLEPKVALWKEDEAFDDARVQKKLFPLVDLFVTTGKSGEINGKPLLQVFEGLHDLKAASDINVQKVLLRFSSDQSSDLERVLDASLNIGSAFVDLPLSGVLLTLENCDEALRLSYGLLQATRRRMSKTEYISCPSCGRTLFDLEETTARIKAVTSHLKGVKIAVMGCIVNGPGEMADADFGYVGGAPGRVNLYVGKECVERNIPSAEAPQALVNLIKKNNRWIEPELTQ